MAGYPWYPLNAGVAPAATILASAIASSSPVLTPGAIAPRSSASTAATSSFAARIRSISAADLHTIMGQAPAAWAASTADARSSATADGACAPFTDLKVGRPE